MVTTFKRKPLALAAACVLPAAALAQTDSPTDGQSTQSIPSATTTATAKPVVKEGSTMQTVEVKASAAKYDPRRDDTASKIVLDAEEIRKYGDTNIYDVLKRAPGVTVTGGNVLRMRGLGAGYTQILVNGDRPPPGFSLDTLTPDQIERIEIVKAASAEYSMQAIAGTINIILRKLVVKPQRDARIAFNRTPQNRGMNLGGTWGERVGSLSYFLNGSAWAGSSEFTSTSADQMRARRHADRRAHLALRRPGPIPGHGVLPAAVVEGRRP